MTNPYRASNADGPQPVASSKTTYSSKTRKTFGVILLVFAGLSLRGLQRPPNSTGNLIDDLPYLGGQLFVTGALAVVGMFLLLRKSPNTGK